MADLGSLMVAVSVLPAALLFHPYWTLSDALQRRTHEGNFYRTLTLLGAALALFAFFESAGHVPFAATGPAISLR